MIYFENICLHAFRHFVLVTSQKLMKLCIIYFRFIVNLLICYDVIFYICTSLDFLKYLIFHGFLECEIFLLSFK